MLKYNNINELKNILSKYEFFKEKEYELKPLKDGNICRTFCMKEKNENKYLVRINDRFSKASVNRELTAINHLNNINIKGINIPKIYYCSEDQEVIVTEFFDNCINLSKLNPDNVDIEFISNEILKISKTVHSIKGYSFPSFYVFIREKIENVTEKAVKKELITKQEQENILAFYDSINYFKKIEPVLIHTDISPDNLIYDKEKRKLYLIDFEFLMYGDKNYDYIHTLKAFEKASIPEYMPKISDEIKEFKNTDVYKLYNLYIDLSWYLIDIDFHKKEDMNKYNDLKNRINNIFFV